MIRLTGGPRGGIAFTQWGFAEEFGPAMLATHIEQGPGVG